MSTKPKVVVAEDEPLIREFAVEFLEDAGFVVVPAKDAEQALTILLAQAEKVHLLFTDVNMPGLIDGLELSHHARENWPWIGILITSGANAPHNDALPPKSRFIAKPYVAKHVLDHARELVPANFDSYKPKEAGC